MDIRLPVYIKNSKTLNEIVKKENNIKNVYNFKEYLIENSNNIDKNKKVLEKYFKESLKTAKKVY